MTNKKKEVLILVARLIIGGIFITTGWMKVSDMATTITYFESMNISSVLAYVVGYSEILGGIAIVFGLWMELAAIGLGIIMLGAVWYSRSTGFAGVIGPSAVFAALLGLIACGAGAYALKIKGKNTQ
jgi:putative oxidoreductase